jgi:hypothetical protein
MMDVTGPDVAGPDVIALNGRVVLAKEHTHYVIKKTWHSTGGCHWPEATWPGVTWAGVTGPDVIG